MDGHHFSFDAVRGADKRILISDSSTAENSPANYVSSFDTDGFTLGSDADVNQNSATHVAWNWKANGQGSSNTDGTINSTYTSANTTSGFSIVTYTGTGSAATVGHGLGTTPSMVWIFNRNGGNAHVFHNALGSTQYLLHASTLAAQTYAPVGIGSLTSTTFSVGTVSGVNGSGKNYVAYVFAEKTGYCRIGSYVGNGSDDGTFIYCGFRPAWIMIKPSSYANSWGIFDDKRPGYNPTKNRLEADGTGAENTALDYFDIVSNGFKVRTSNGHPNTDGGTLIYMALASAPIVGTNNIPAVAR